MRKIELSGVVELTSAALSSTALGAGSAGAEILRSAQDDCMNELRDYV